MELRRIIYTSHAIEQFSKRNLLDLLHYARTFNKIDNITGRIKYLKPSSLAFIAIGKAPLIGCKLPDSKCVRMELAFKCILR